MLDLTRIRIIAGTDHREFRDMSKYAPAWGLVGRVIEFVGELPNDINRQFLFFKDGTYLEIETSAS